MSAFVSIKTEFEDPDCVVDMLKDMGYTPEVHEEPQQLLGYHNDVRSQRANIIVRRNQVGSASNDFGFVKNENGKYDFWLSNYDHTAVPARQGVKGKKGLLDKMAQGYAVHKVTKTAKLKRWTIKKTKQKDGSVKVHLTSWK